MSSSTGGPGENQRPVTDKLYHITEQSRIYLWVWVVSLSTICRLGFRTVLTMWYFFHRFLSFYFKKQYISPTLDSRSIIDKNDYFIKYLYIYTSEDLTLPDY